MSRSLARVQAEAQALGLPIRIVHLPQGTSTAQAAADAVGTVPARIIKSILFRVDGADEHVLFLTAGNNRVDPARAAQVAGAALVRADAASIRAWTGFAIGGVSPLGHLNPVRRFLDPDILAYDTIWAAAGTPAHVFEISPALLAERTGAVVADFTE